MSTSRQRKRINKPKNNGRIIPLHERKVKDTMVNEGGYYKGMPGVTVDELGNRKLIDFITTEKGYDTARIYAHPKIIKLVVQKACENNKELGAIVLGSAIDSVFKRKTPLNLLIRFGLYLKRRRSYRTMVRKSMVKTD